MKKKQQQQQQQQTFTTQKFQETHAVFILNNLWIITLQN